LRIDLFKNLFYYKGVRSQEQAEDAARASTKSLPSTYLYGNITRVL